MAKKPFYTILFVSWVVFVTLLSLFSFTESDLPSIKIPHIDKLVHFIFYFVSGILGILSLKEFFNEAHIRQKGILYLFCSLAVYGIIIEILQSVLTVTRSGEVLDFLANTIGVLAGVALAKFLFLRQ